MPGVLEVGFSDPNLCGRHRQITANHDVDVRLNDGERVREVPVDFFSVLVLGTCVIGGMVTRSSLDEDQRL